MRRLYEKIFGRNKRKELQQLYEQLYKRACDRHEGDLYLWACMSKSERKLQELEQEINNCGCCAPQSNEEVK